MAFTIDIHHHILPDFFWQATNEQAGPVGGIAPARWSTDAAISFEKLQPLVAGHCNGTFNCITVDSDTSTSDTLLVAATRVVFVIYLFLGSFRAAIIPAAVVPVCLIGDIDKGGVIASLVGTQEVLAPEDAQMIDGFLINKFRVQLLHNCRKRRKS